MTATYVSETGSVPCEIVRVIQPGGFWDRLFGGRLPVYVIRVSGDTFAVHAGAITL